MTTTTIETDIAPARLARILDEGYGPGAWHGADMKAALEEVEPNLAFWRPAEGRHNIAEIALHHAWCVRSVRTKLGGKSAEPFVLEGEDWFELSAEGPLAWSTIQATLAEEQRRLAETISCRENDDAEAFDLTLGVTCHAVYHAGQVQLIKRLHGT